MFFRTNDNAYIGACSFLQGPDNSIITDLNLSSMEALDIVKECYAANFEKIYYTEDEQPYSTGDEALYYYKLPIADYYLVYEGFGETEKEYLIHLYEFVVDEPETGIGHTFTYGWYTVDRETGIIKTNK
jgi:predicted small secreted protein